MGSAAGAGGGGVTVPGPPGTGIMMICGQHDWQALRGDWNRAAPGGGGHGA